ncbi:MAG: stage II sporulation protein D [Oscillospiraceae bacterium]|nr:stage II sporulation protein D [Oscillospiraceae bacterium]
MRQHLFFGLLVLCLLLLVPLLSLAWRVPSDVQPPQPQQQTTQAQPAQQESSRTVQVLRQATGEVEIISLEEYLIGVVAAEMPALFHEQALMAQAVAAYTFMRYRLEVGGANTISDAWENDQGYLCPEQRRERWGASFAQHEETITRAVREVYGYSLQFNGLPIFAAYHAMSAGQTENAGDYWGRDLPFLRSVESPGCRLAPNFEVTTSFTLTEIRQALGKLPGVSLTGEPVTWFGTPVLTHAGTVAQIPVGDAMLTGRQLRQALAQRSANFTMEFTDGEFHITTRGFGHGVGMSQTGADYMAQQGSTWREILAHYYQGTDLVSASGT